MNKLVALILATTAISASAHEISVTKYAELLKNYHACFILYNVNKHKIISE